MKGLFRIGRSGAQKIKGSRGRQGACGPVPPSSVSTGSTGPFNAGEAAIRPSNSQWKHTFANVKRTKDTSFRSFSTGNGGGNRFAGGSGGGGGGGDGSSGSGWEGGLWVAYLSLLERKPVATKAVTAAVLNGVGDVIAQIFLNENGKFDWKRLGIFSALGLVLIGPALHVWYGTLARVVTASGTMGALGRMAMDQLLFAPIFIGTIVSSIMILEGHGSDVPSKMRSDLFTIVRSNWALWVPFQFLNFRFVPVHLQVLASNIVALAWNTYISWASHTNEKTT